MTWNFAVEFYVDKYGNSNAILDEALDIGYRSKISPRAFEFLVDVATKVSYQEAANILAETGGSVVSVNTIMRAIRQVGEDCKAEDAKAALLFTSKVFCPSPKWKQTKFSSTTLNSFEKTTTLWELWSASRSICINRVSLEFLVRGRSQAWTPLREFVHANIQAVTSSFALAKKPFRRRSLAGAKKEFTKFSKNSHMCTKKLSDMDIINLCKRI